MKLTKGKLLAALAIVAVLAAAFWYGGNAPGLQGWTVQGQESGAVLEDAAQMGAGLLVTACPLCLYNLTKNAPAGRELPVVYFTQLLAQALGVDAAREDER